MKLWKQVPDLSSDIDEDTSIDDLHDNLEDLFDDPLQCRCILGYNSTEKARYTYNPTTTKGLGSIYHGRRVKDRDGSDPTSKVY